MIFETRVKQILRRYIREQLEDRTVAGSPQREQVQQQNSINLMMNQLALAVADGNKKKLELSKRDPHFQKTIGEIGDLVKELQGLLQQGN